MIKKILVSLLLTFFLAGCNSVSTKKASQTKPNILFVFADQMRSHALECYGNEQLKTPNIDRLAQEGVMFRNAISTAPVCSPYRAMLMSGNFPLKNGMVLNDHFLRNPTPYFAEVCKSAGYQTGYIGKWHLDGYDREGYIPPERRLGFDYWRAFECTHDYFNSKYFHQDEKEPRVWPGYDAVAQADTACEFIAHYKDVPFCLFLSWGPPHGPYAAPAEYEERFINKDIKFRENVNDFETARKMWRECDTETVPESWKKTREKSVAWWGDSVSNDEILRRYRLYYASIQTLDDCFGRILATLDSTGQLDNTVIVFTSDHGDNLFSHRQIGKQLPFEESISVPFLIRYPEKIKPYTLTDALLAPVDIMPTVLSLAGIPCHDVDGHDISAAAMGEAIDVQDAVLIMKTIPLGTNWIHNGNGAWRGVRTKQYTYARKSDTREPWMLFDNLNDPLQMHNLIGDPSYTDLQVKMNKLTDELLERADDPEDPEFFARLIQKEREEHGVPDRWNELSPPHVKAGSPFYAGKEK
jgi:arylsulfatase A-like enzyme